MPRFIFLLVATGLLFLVDLYVFQAIQTAMQHLPYWSQQGITIFYWCFFAATIITLWLATITPRSAPSGLKTYWLSFFFIVFASKLIVVLLLLAEDGTRLARSAMHYFANRTAEESNAVPEINRSEFFSKLALVAGSIPFTALIYGMVKGAFQYQIKKVVLHFPNLPASFNGFKMVQISDLHTGSFRSYKPLRQAVNLINEQNADVVFFTGDLVNNVADEVQPYIPVLGQLRGKIGVFSVLGNHDYGDYVSWPTRIDKLENLERLKHSHARMGWRLLLNEHYPVERNGEKIAILGVENWGNRAGFPKYGKMQLAHAGTEAIPFKVLLSHDPSHWDGEVNQLYPDIDLMLSGHTHGMQFGVNLPNFKWSPVQYVYRQWAGLYKKGTQHLYVNVGLGFIGYPGRVGFLPEITVFELRRT